jgi:hypothetical protein
MFGNGTSNVAVLSCAAMTDSEKPDPTAQGNEHSEPSPADCPTVLFSQPLSDSLTGRRTVHGLIGWKSIGRAHVVRTAGPNVGDCMDREVHVLPTDMPLLTAVNEIIKYELVLVQDQSETNVGIVTFH